jgi:hypothetical protein
MPLTAPDGAPQKELSVVTRLLLVVLLVLAGCAERSGTALWRGGSDADARSRDLSDCRDQARVATQRDTSIDQDITSSRGNDWQRTGVLRAHQDDMQSSNINRFGDLVGSCMKARGYRLGDAP